MHGATTITYGQIMAEAGLPCASVACARCRCSHPAPEAARIGPSLCDMHRPAAAAIFAAAAPIVGDDAPAELIYGNGIIDDDELCEDFGDC